LLTKNRLFFFNKPYKIKLSWKNLTSFSLVLLFLPEFIHPEGNILHYICYFVAAVMLMTGLVRCRNLTREEKTFLLPLVFLFLIGSFHSGSDKFNYYKDMWYFSKPVLFIGAGIIAQKTGIKRNYFLGMILYFSLALSLKHICFFLLMPQLLAESLMQIREVAGGGNLLIAFSVAYISRRKRFLEVKNFLNIPRLALLLILYSSMLLSWSRTIFAVYLITMIFLERIYDIKYIKRSIGTIAFVGALLVCVFLFLNSTPMRANIEEITRKIFSSYSEILVSSKYTNTGEISNWRGYETALAINKIANGSIGDQIWGYGFGATVFIGFDDILGFGIYDIPLLHNGFIHIALKTGYLGVLLYIGFFFNLMKIIRKHKFIGDATGDLLAGILMSSFFTTLVITGYYNKSALNSTCIISGYLLSWIINNRRMSIQSTSKNNPYVAYNRSE
jgi:hypothetical protein